jgi:hypothetical protein
MANATLRYQKFRSQKKEKRRKLSPACCQHQDKLWVLHQKINKSVNITHIKHKIFVKLTEKLKVE